MSAFIIKHVQHWPHTRMVWRGDGAYYIFGLAGNPALDALVPS